METRQLIEVGLLERALDQLSAALEGARGRVASAVRQDGMDAHQVAAYELAWGEARRQAAAATLEWAQTAGDDLALTLAGASAGDAVLKAREFCECATLEYGISGDVFAGGPMAEVVQATQAPSFLAGLGRKFVDGAETEDIGSSTTERQLRTRFRQFAETVVKPRAQEIHRRDLDVPDEIVDGAAKLGLFGLSVPVEFGGSQGPAPEAARMLIATEELARTSLLAGSLITRPEILIKALLKAGSDAQRRRWLPAIASGEKMVAVAVTERDFGSDVAGLTSRATRTSDGSWKVSGDKYWCGFAARAEIMMILCRTGAEGHGGLSLFVLDKPRFDGHSFEYRQEGGGRLKGRAIPTIGYRGMHTFELHFADLQLPAEALIGGEEWLNRGFYLQMEGFSMSRLQTAARAVGVMQGALADAVARVKERVVFGRRLADYQLPLATIGRMAMRVNSGRQLARHASRMREGTAALDCTLAKLYAARMAELVTRDAVQLHGGLGYSEELDVSRQFVDARLLPIFEGTDEVLALRVVARALLRGSDRDD